jgi:2-dehydropantoate 2-reductase
MKILVYGAGVLGSLLAWRLQEAGQDVWLLARGQRLADLQAHGLVFENMVNGRRSTAPVKVVEALGPEQAYDLVLVVMGKHQVGSTLPSLAANRHTPNVLFLGNNLAGPDEMVAALGWERVLLGFPLAGGTMQGEVVRYAAGMGAAFQARAVIGELDGQVSPRLEQIAAVFEAAGFSTSFSANIDAWLKTHAIGILPLGAAYYATGLDPNRMAGTRDALALVVRGMREGARVLNAHAIPVLPLRQRVLLWLPEPLLVFLFSRLLRQELYQYALAHAPHMRPELLGLAADFQSLARARSVPTPSMDRLCALLELSASPLPAGSAHIRLDWRPAWVALAVLSGLLFGMVWVKRRNSPGSKYGRNLLSTRR